MTVSKNSYRGFPTNLKYNEEMWSEATSAALRCDSGAVKSSENTGNYFFLVKTSLGENFMSSHHRHCVTDKLASQNYISRVEHFLVAKKSYGINIKY